MRSKHRLAQGLWLRGEERDDAGEAARDERPLAMAAKSASSWNNSTTLIQTLRDKIGRARV